MSAEALLLLLPTLTLAQISPALIMTVGVNRFLRIYYGKVKEYPASLEQLPAIGTDQNI